MLIISIHAPREGATKTETRTVKITLFQSTLPVRERPRLRPAPSRSPYFNPRSP